MENYIDLSKLYKNNSNNYIWDEIIGIPIQFLFNGVCGEMCILRINEKLKYKIDVSYKNKIYIISKQQLIECKLNTILKIKKEIPFKYNVGDTFIDNKRNMEILEQNRDIHIDKDGCKHNIRNYRCKCYICGSSNMWISESHLNENRGCSVCHSKQFDENIISIPITAPWMIPYFQGGYDEAIHYTKSASRKIYFKCPDCGEIKEKEMTINKLYMRHSIGCSCGDGISYPEKLMMSCFEQLNIKYIKEYSPDWIKPKRYDFYFELDDNKYIVEMDGGLGHGNNIHPKSNKTKDELLLIDHMKDKIAYEHDIQVIRIDCLSSELDYIKDNLLGSNLSQILDIHKVDWKKCQEFALRNIVKTVCDYKNNNPFVSPMEIAVEFNLDHSTICRYLNKGNKIGWCNYNGNTYKVEVLKDNISLGIYNSSTHLSSISENILGYKISASRIRALCNSDTKNTKGFKTKGYEFRYLLE